MRHSFVVLESGMKYRFFFFLSLLCIPLTFKAAPVDSLTALRVADAFRTAMVGQSPSGIPVDGASLGINNLYLFNYGENDGFVIVAGDDRAMPVLAYSSVGHIQEHLPNVVDYWLRGYEEAINAVRAQDVQADEETMHQWAVLINGAYAVKPTKAVRAMLSSAWDQSDYYNDLCPVDEVSGKHMPAGCVAVAMAQIMRYWSFPKSGLGEHSYIDKTAGLQSADFRQTVYAWNKMPNQLSSISSSVYVEAISTLIYHCGVAVDMEYSMSGSGAYNNSYNNGSLPCAEHALSRYFDYKSSIQSAYREDYNSVSWKNLIRAELRAGRPIIYGSRDVDLGGHAFVCDGFDGDFFHFNWGWSGDYNGFYRISALSPGINDGIEPLYSFDNDHSLVIGIEPNTHLRVDTSRMVFDAEGGEFVVAVTSESGNSTNWSASTPKEWIHLSIARGIGGGKRTTITITADSNTTGVARNDTIVVRQGSKSVSIFVSQLACLREEMCQLSVKMSDDCADSWNYAYLDLCDTLGGSYGKAFLIAGQESDVVNIGVCPQPVRLVWRQGVWDEECGFSVICPQGKALYNHFHGQKITATELEKISHPCNCEMTYLIAVASSNPDHGSVAGAGEFRRGDIAAISAESLRGYHFVHWQDGDTANPRNVMVQGDATYTAYFEPNIYKVSATLDNDAAGSIRGTGYYAFGDTATLQAIPASGYHFLQWDNGVTDSIYHFAVDTDINLTAFFAANEPASLAYPYIENVSISLSAKTLTVQGAAGHWISVSDVLGRRIYHRLATSNTVAIPLKQRGVYVIGIDGRYAARRVCY